MMMMACYAKIKTVAAVGIFERSFYRCNYKLCYSRWRSCVQLFRFSFEETEIIMLCDSGKEETESVVMSLPREFPCTSKGAEKAVQ